MTGHNNVDSLLLVIWNLISILVLKKLIGLVKNNPHLNAVRLGAIFYVIVAGVLPLILIKEGILANSVFNIILSGGAVIYFALLLSRMK
jgi:hypothetical protein